MKIKWLGHASFLLTAGDKRIITDPYEPGCYDGAVGYKPIKMEADIVTISHEHADHNYFKDIKGNPEVIRESGIHEVKGIKIEGISVYHDKSQGKERGKNTIFVMELEGLRICHLGDLGHLLSEAEIKKIKPLDVLFVPTGGYYTIDAYEAEEVVEKLEPKVVIPMHFKTSVLGFPIAKVDEFTKGKKNVKRLGCETEITKEALPKAREIWVLEHAL